MFELIGRHGIECWPMRSGLVFAAHSPSGKRDLERRTQYWQQRGAPVEMLEGARCAETIGSRLYASASLDRRGGNINPFAYARGLARPRLRQARPSIQARGFAGWHDTTGAGRSQLTVRV